MNQPVTFQVNGTFMASFLPFHCSSPIRTERRCSSCYCRERRARLKSRRRPTAGSYRIVRRSRPGGDPLSDDIEAIKQLKARYCRFLDTKDIDAWRALFVDDVVVKLDMAVSAGGADPQTAHTA